MEKVTLTTSRLFLREFSLKDDENLFNLNSDVKVLKHTGDEPFHSIGEARSFIKSYDDYKKNGFGRCAVIIKESNEFIGWCGLKKNPDGIIDLGFRFFSKHWNNGYATESATAILDYGFNELGLTDIIARTSTNNMSSIKVIQKLGLTFWKTELYDNLGLCHFYKIHNE